MSEFPKDWKEVRLMDIGKYINGAAFKPKDWSMVGLPIIRIQNLNNPDAPFNYCNFKIAERFIISNGDLLFAWSGTPGTSFGAHIWDGKKAVLNQHIFKVVYKNDLIDKYYFKNVLNYTVDNYIKQAHGSSGLAHITKSKFENSTIPLPPLPEQKRIVAKLDALFERIDKSIALLEENIRLTKSLMDSVLGEVFGIGDTPLSEVCIVNPKKSEVSVLNRKTEVSFLPMANLNEHNIKYEVQVIKKLEEVYKGYTYFKDGDVLLAKVTPCFENGKAGVCYNLKNSIGFGSSEFHVIRPRTKVLSEWVYYSVMTEHFRKSGVKHMTGSSGLKRVPASFISNWKIKLPSLKVQQQTLAKIDHSIKNIKFLKYQQNSKLGHFKSLKSSLLDRAFKGEL